MMAPNRRIQEGNGHCSSFESSLVHMNLVVLKYIGEKQIAQDRYLHEIYKDGFTAKAEQLINVASSASRFRRRFLERNLKGMKFVEANMRNLQLGLECIYASEHEQCLSTYRHAKIYIER
ncbi:hypothetical protein YC2023_056119 [Brassica napus]